MMPVTPGDTVKDAYTEVAGEV
ncbi:hypothetical protein LCGC14_2678470, partial [marine sediment metagenome]